VFRHDITVFGGLSILAGRSRMGPSWRADVRQAYFFEWRDLLRAARRNDSIRYRGQLQFVVAGTFADLPLE